jgi:hypothetical protein
MLFWAHNCVLYASLAAFSSKSQTKGGSVIEIEKGDQQNKAPE